MRVPISFWTISLSCFTIITQVHSFPEPTMAIEEGNATVTAIWNTYQSPYVNLTEVLLNGYDSMIAYNGSQLDLWRMENDGYVLQKSCNLEEIHKLAVFPNSSVVCFIINSSILILYDTATCRSLVMKDFGYGKRFNVYDIKTTKNHILVEFYQDSPKLFNWNGADLKSVEIATKIYHEVEMSQNGLVASRRSVWGDDLQQLCYFNTSSRRSTTMRTGIEFGSYRLSPDGRYSVFSYEDDRKVAIYDLATKRQLFKCSSLSGSVRKVLMDGDRLYILFSNGIKEIDGITIAYIHISTSPENPENRNLTFTTIDLGGSKIFPDQVDIRRINGTSYHQVISKKGKLNFFKLKNDGQTWTPLQ